MEAYKGTKVIMVVRITDRDSELFAFIYENHFVSFGQIHNTIFPEKSLSTTQTRISKLCRTGYLSSIKRHLTLYKLTTQSLRLLNCTEDDMERYLQRRIHDQQINHDLEVTDCKNIFRKTNLSSNWLPSHRLYKYCYTENGIIKVPDAIFDFRIKGVIKKAALEIELSQKKHKRYEKLIRKYHYNMRVDLVLYIVKKPNIKSKLLSIGKIFLDYNSNSFEPIHNKLFVTMLDEFKTKQLEAIFVAPNEDAINLGDLMESPVSPPVYTGLLRTQS